MKNRIREKQILRNYMEFLAENYGYFIRHDYTSLHYLLGRLYQMPATRTIRSAYHLEEVVLWQKIRRKWKTWKK